MSNESNVSQKPNFPYYKELHHRSANGVVWLHDVGLSRDGSVLFNPRNYPEKLVREALRAAEWREHEFRSKAAKQAAITRAQRQKLQVYKIAGQMLAGQQIGPRKSCVICGRFLSDPESIARGIGSECWGNVLASIEERRRAAGQEPVQQMLFTGIDD